MDHKKKNLNQHSLDNKTFVKDMDIRTPPDVDTLFSNITRTLFLLSHTLHCTLFYVLHLLQMKSILILFP
jgi:hypothetical protein